MSFTGAFNSHQSNTFGNILILISSTIVKRIIQSKKPTILHKQEENRHSIYTQITNLCKISSHSFFTFSFSIFMEGEAKCTIEEIVNRITKNSQPTKKKKKEAKTQTYPNIVCPKFQSNDTLKSIYL